MLESSPWATAWRVCIVLLLMAESGWRLKGVAMAMVASRPAATMDFMAAMMS